MRIGTGTWLAVCAGLAVALLAATPEPGARTGAGAGRSAGACVESLGARTARERDAAFAALAALGESARPALEAALASPDAEVRSRARSLLARLAEDDADRSARRYREAVAVLHSSGAAEEALRPDGDAARRLGELMPESAAALADLARLAGRRTLVRAPLASALARTATPATLAALAALWRDEAVAPSAALAAARELDDATDGDPERASGVRAAAAGALAVLGDPLAPREAPRRRGGIALAAALAGPDAAADILRAVRDPAPGVRAESARLLARHGIDGAAEAVRALAADADADVRAAALSALARIPGRPDPAPAVAASDDPSPPVRRAAASLLGREATPAEIPVLERLAADPSPSVRAAARRSLAALAPR